ncbi:MAG TPA: hypothetical protein DDZ89_07315 [Clostridiales bacterium]|nr:hypothetical protein [Clostridiales bacterium]
MDYWVFYTVSEQTNYFGHEGYEDDIENVYRYNNNVPNFKQVQRNDIIFLRNKETIIGFARIKDIKESIGERVFYRCPNCDSTKLKRRKTKNPVYRCSICKHECDHPLKSEDSCTNYEAYFDIFTYTNGRISLQAVKNSIIKPSDQLSIQKLDIDKLESIIGFAIFEQRDTAVVANVSNKLLELKDEHDVMSISKQIEIPSKRTHNKMTNKLFQSFNKLGIEALEGAKQDCLYDCLIRIHDKYLLIEVKSDTDKGSVRLAIGQLFDYKMTLCNKYCYKREDVDLAILLPYRPEESSITLLDELGIRLLHFEDGSMKKIIGLNV